MTYLAECTKYFQPLDESQDALDNNEGVAGISYLELVSMVEFNKELKHDLTVANNGMELNLA